MPGENTLNPQALQESLRHAAGKSAADLTEGVISTIGTLAEAVQGGSQSHAGLERAVEDIRKDLAAAQAVALEAKRTAMPAGKDADTIRHYQDTHAPKREVLRLDERARGDRVDGQVPFIASGDATPIRMLGGYDDLNEWRYGYLDDPNPRTAAQKDVQKTASLLALTRAMQVRPERLPRRLSRQLAALPGFSRMFADNATEGAEWIPDTPGATLIQYMQMPRVVADLFETMPIPRPDMTNPFQTSGLQPFLVGQPVSGDLDPAKVRQSQIGTASITYSPKTFVVSAPANRDASEDSIVAFGPTMLMAVAQALVDAREDALINGDTNGGDTLSGWTGGGRWPSAATGGSDDHRKAYIGLRNRALDDSATADFDNASISVDMFKLRGKLTKGFSHSDLVYITSLETLIYHMLSDANLMTVDKFGATLATLLTGQVAMHGGIPVVLSEFVTADLNTAGAYDGSTVSQTGLLLVDRSRIKRPQTRAARTEVAVRPERHALYVVGSDREGLTYECGSGEKPVAYGIDISNDGT